MATYSALGFAEPINSWSHLLGAIVYFFLTIQLLRSTLVSGGYSLFIAIFGFSCVFLFSMSGVYHLLSIGGSGRFILRALDHAGIYLIIAGTFTAVHGILFCGLMKWGVIILVWMLAINGIVLSTIYTESIPELWRLLSYLALGWLGIISGIFLWREHGMLFIKTFIFGGLAYTVGAVLEFFRQPVLIAGIFGPHELFHFAVLLGTGFHWAFVIKSLKVKR